MPRCRPPLCHAANCYRRRDRGWPPACCLPRRVCPDHRSAPLVAEDGAVAKARRTARRFMPRKPPRLRRCHNPRRSCRVQRLSAAMMSKCPRRGCCRLPSTLGSVDNLKITVPVICPAPPVYLGVFPMVFANRQTGSTYTPLVRGIMCLCGVEIRMIKGLWDTRTLTVGMHTVHRCDLLVRWLGESGQHFPV